MSNVVYVSEATVTRLGGPNRRAEIPATDHPVLFGAHGSIAEHYGTDLATFGETATTIDYVVAATGG